MIEIKTMSPAVIDVRGDIDLREVSQIKHEVTGLADRGQPNIILHVKGVDTISFYAVGALMGLRLQLIDLGGELKTAGASEFVTRIFRRAGAEAWIESYASVEDAMLSFESDWDGGKETVQ